MASKNLANIKDTQTDLIAQRRFRKYQQQVSKKPALRNVFSITGDEKKLIHEGIPIKPIKIDGYIKLPGSNVMESLHSLEQFSIALLPGDKMIVEYKGKPIFRGYRKNGNTEDFMLILYVAGSIVDWLVLDLDQDEVPLLINFSIEKEDNFNRIIYDIVKNLLKQNTTVSLSDEAGIIVESEEDDDYDGFE